MTELAANIEDGILFLRCRLGFMKPNTAFSLCGRDIRVVRSLDPFSKYPVIETTLRPVPKNEKRICELSVIPGLKANGITRYGHIVRKDQDRTARLVYLFSGPPSIIPVSLMFLPL